MNIHKFVKTLTEQYKTWKPPIVTFVANRGATPFQILVSTLLSLRTKDEVTAAAASRLFQVATTPEQILSLSEARLRDLIYPVGFYPTKAKRLHDISRVILEECGGEVPDTMEGLLRLAGVGRKTANLVLVEAHKKEGLCVDTHVHRISNRIGYVATKTPHQTEFALRDRLPKKYWRRYNELLVAFGQVVCKPISPLCSSCPVRDMCPRIGVGRSR